MTENDYEKPQNLPINDQISPLCNQGILIEIKRIRHRGILEDYVNKIFNTGKPFFYYIVKSEDVEISSKELTGHYYNTWDTITKQNRIIIDVDEEQQTSNVVIEIFESKQKIFQKEISKTTIELIYDFRSGRWSGDDNFQDNDGYGHYIGNNFELWFNIYQTDFDGDGIPYWTERNILGTNPMEDDSKLDPDKDGIPTSWEWYWGYDPFGWNDHMNLDPDIDGIQNIEEFSMNKWFSDPYQQDIYLEIDFMKKQFFTNKHYTLYDEVKQIISEEFCKHGINIYIDDDWPSDSLNAGGSILPFSKKISWDFGSVLQFYDNYFLDSRIGIFRYIILCADANPLAFSGNTNFNRYDTIVIGCKYFSLLPKKASVLLTTSILMHELGHTLGVAPYTIEGCDNMSFLPINKYKDEWGNYKSVMNYLYLPNPKIFSYSEGTNGHNDQNDWKMFYLPFFQQENNIICEPGIEPPANERVVPYNESLDIPGWRYDMNMTDKYLNEFSNLYHIKSGDFQIKVFIQENITNQSKIRINIYAKPNVPISGWSLINEGYIDKDGSINLL